MYEQLMQLDNEENELMNYDDTGKPKKRVRIKLEDIYEPITARVKLSFHNYLYRNKIPLIFF